MSGIRIGGKASPSDPGGPPFSLYEGTTDPYTADQANVWRKVNGVLVRITPFSDATCTPVCSDEPHTPRLSPDRQVVAYSDFDPEGSGSQQLRIAAADGSEGSIGSYPDTVLYDNIGEPEFGLWINHPCWHPDGDRLIFTDASPDNGYGLGGVIKEVTYPGGVATTLWTPDQQTGVQRENAYHPWYSPDGTKIAFIVDADAGTTCGTNNLDCSRQGLWVMDADGSNAQQISGPWYSSPTPMAAILLSGTQIAWSNDSQWIAFVQQSFGGEGDWGVYKIKADGTGETLLLTGDPSRRSFIGWGAWLDGDAELIVSTIDTSSESGISIQTVATDGSEALTMLVDNSAPAAEAGPANQQNFQACYRDLDRIWYITRTNLSREVRSCALDGSDVVIELPTTADVLIAAGVGFEWV